jgi:hypothetical protein
MLGRYALGVIALLALANPAKAVDASAWNGVWVGALGN